MDVDTHRPTETWGETRGPGVISCFLFVKQHAQGHNHIQKSYFWYKGHSQGHKVTNLSGIWNASLEMYACKI